MWLVKTYHRHSGNTCFSLSLSLRVFPAIITKHCPYDVWLLQNCFLPKLSATGAANCTNGYQHRNINGKVCSVFHVQCLPLKHWESHASSITYIPTQTAWSSIGSILFGIHMRCMREMGLVTCRQKEIHQTKAAELLSIDQYKASAPTSLWRSNGNPVPNDLPQLP